MGLLAVPALAASRLDAASRRAFRGWFTFLAEAAATLDPLPVEIADCSSLLRFAYREALAPHTAEWARRYGFSWLPPLAEIGRAGALFSTPQGLRHFADAEHLMRFNARPLGRDLAAAQPADLLFYRQHNPRSPYHAMAFLGPGYIEPHGPARVVYHTGPEGAWRGELRRPSLKQLLAHPEPRWRPVAGNPNFLGLFRWNLLADLGD